MRVTRGRCTPLSSTDLCAAPRPPASTWSASQCGQAGWDSRVQAGCPRSAVSAGQPQPAAHHCSNPTAPCGPARAAPQQRPGTRTRNTQLRQRWEPLSCLHPACYPTRPAGREDPQRDKWQPTVSTHLWCHQWLRGSVLVSVWTLKGHGPWSEIWGPSNFLLTLRFWFTVARRRGGSWQWPREKGSGPHSNIGCPTPRRKMRDLRRSPTSEREALNQKSVWFFSGSSGKHCIKALGAVPTTVLLKAALCPKMRHESNSWIQDLRVHVLLEPGAHTRTHTHAAPGP